VCVCGGGGEKKHGGKILRDCHAPNSGGGGIWLNLLLNSWTPNKIQTKNIYLQEITKLCEVKFKSKNSLETPLGSQSQVFEASDDGQCQNFQSFTFIILPHDFFLSPLSPPHKHTHTHESHALKF
jgi:hypothetical protein